MHFPLLRNTLADFLHPIGGIYITNLGDKMYLLKFFYNVNLNRVLDGKLGIFNNHLILMKKVMPAKTR